MTEEDVVERVERNADSLNLTDQQEKKVLEFELEFYKERQKMFENFDPQTGDREAMRAKMMKQRDERNEKYAEVLTEDQLEKFKQMQDRRRQQMRQRREEESGEQRGRGRGEVPFRLQPSWSGRSCRSIQNGRNAASFTGLMCYPRCLSIPVSGNIYIIMMRWERHRLHTNFIKGWHFSHSKATLSETSSLVSKLCSTLYSIRLTNASIDFFNLGLSWFLIVFSLVIFHDKLSTFS